MSEINLIFTCSEEQSQTPLLTLAEMLAMPFIKSDKSLLAEHKFKKLSAFSFSDDKSILLRCKIRENAHIVYVNKALDKSVVFSASASLDDVLFWLGYEIEQETDDILEALKDE